MRRLWVLVGVVLLVVVGAAVALGQDGLIGRFSPFVVDVEQVVPVEVTIPVTLENGDVVTATAPLTVSVALRVKVEGPAAAVVEVLEEGAPTVSVESEQVDDLGFTYVLQAGDDGLELTEWTAYENSNGNLEFAGELRNTTEEERLSLADIVVRLYRKNGKLLKVETFTASGRWVEPGEVHRFGGASYEDISQIDHYDIEIVGRDWQAATE